MKKCRYTKILMTKTAEYSDEMTKHDHTISTYCKLLLTICKIMVKLLLGHDDVIWSGGKAPLVSIEKMSG
jgi:hypothetical protein